MRAVSEIRTMARKHPFFASLATLAMVTQVALSALAVSVDPVTFGRVVAAI